ncbi:MAG: hypothetical protein ABW044_06910 [Cellvibrio sp.]
MNIRNITLMEEAAHDMLDGRAFYRTQAHGIGDYFWDSLLSDIESLYIYAGVHEEHFGLFRMLSKRFPYAIYYQINEQIAYVVAILPVRRSPSWIINRLPNP